MGLVLVGLLGLALGFPRPIPACPEDAVIVGSGDFEHGYWTTYDCIAEDERPAMKGQAIEGDVIAHIVELREEGLPVRDIVALTGASKATVERIRIPDASAKDRVLAAVVEHGPLADLAALSAVLPDVDTHTAVHLLWSLQKGERVRFREHRAGTRRALTDIEAVARRPGPSQAQADVMAAEAGYTNGHAPTFDPAIEVVIVGAPEPVTGPGLYPSIAAEVERRAHVASAVRALETAGLDDLALLALASVDEADPLVTEAVRLYEATMAD